MKQDNLRQQVKHLKANGVSYKKIADGIQVIPSSFYSWVQGHYNFSYDTEKRLEQWLKEELLNRTPRGKKYNTVRNLINLLEQYNFADDEVIKELPQYDNNIRYYVSNKGAVFSLCGTDWIKKVPQKDKDGYLYVDIYCNGERTRKRIHTLVCEAFMDIDLTDKVIHHIDNQRTNNNLENLVPMTREQHNKIHQIL